MKKLTLVLCGVLAMLLPAAPPAAIEGDYIEERSNHVHGCSCEWSGESVTGGKEATLAWKFARGDYGGVNMAGVKIAVVIQGEGTLSQGHVPRKSVLLLDREATDAQRKASERLVTDYFGDLIGAIISRHVMAIDFLRTPERARLKVEGLLNVEMRKAKLPEDALSGALRWYDPFITLEEYELGTTLNTTFQGSEFDYRWTKSEPGTRSYYGKFRLTGPAPGRGPVS
jgi:hypothetical protein